MDHLRKQRYNHFHVRVRNIVGKFKVVNFHEDNRPVNPIFGTIRKIPKLSKTIKLKGTCRGMLLRRTCYRCVERTTEV